METKIVIAFQIDNSPASIPTTWIIGTDECVWPPLTSDKITAAIKKP